MSTAAIIVFARAPRAGATKTRLIPALGPEGAARVYARLLARTCGEVAGVADVTRYLYADEPAAATYFRARLPACDWEIGVQQGANLGERMVHALAAVCVRHRRAILIGSDIVDFNAADLTQALQALVADAEVVLGPAADGGYWLVGLSCPQPTLFADIAWGSAQVYQHTIEKLNAQGTRWARVRECHDIDTPTDFAQHAARLADGATLTRVPLLASELCAELFDPARLPGLQVDKPRA